MSKMNGEDENNLHIVFSTGPYDYHERELEKIDVIDGLESFSFEDDWVEIEARIDDYLKNNLIKEEEMDDKCRIIFDDGISSDDWLNLQVEEQIDNVDFDTDEDLNFDDIDWGDEDD